MNAEFDLWEVFSCFINYNFWSWRRFYTTIWCCKLRIWRGTVYLYPHPLANTSNVHRSCWRKKKTNMVHCWNFNWRYTHLLAKDNSKRCKSWLPEINFCLTKMYRKLKWSNMIYKYIKEPRIRIELLLMLCDSYSEI